MRFYKIVINWTVHSSPYSQGMPIIMSSSSFDSIVAIYVNVFIFFDQHKLGCYCLQFYGEFKL
jgi:hypothetical protein